MDKLKERITNVSIDRLTIIGSIIDTKAFQSYHQYYIYSPCLGYTENKNQTCHWICHGRPGVTSGTDKSPARGKSRHDSKELYLKQDIAENKNNRLTKL